MGFLAKGQPPLSSLPTLSAHTGAQLHTELGGSLHGDSTGYNLVSWRMGPHPGPPAVSCEGLCVVQCTTWGRGRGCPGGESCLGSSCKQSREKKSDPKERDSAPEQRRQWPFKAPGALCGADSEQPG